MLFSLRAIFIFLILIVNTPFSNASDTFLFLFSGNNQTTIIPGFFNLNSWWFPCIIVFVLAVLVLVFYRYRIYKKGLPDQKVNSLVNEKTSEPEGQNNKLQINHEKIVADRDELISQKEELHKQIERLEADKGKLSMHIKEQADKLNVAKDKAEESDKLKTAFLENISHEIRTPLNAILGFINLLIEKKEDQESRNYYLRIINESGKSMLKLVEDIIDFSRIQIGELRPEYNKCNVTELIKELVSINREKMAREKPKLNILAKLPKDEIIAITDEKKLIQIFTKLIENSIKFTEEGYVSIGIHKYNDTHLTFLVEDTGIGIDPKHTDKIFDRFYTVHYEDQKEVYRGSGLGLAFAKVVTELLGGKIWVESQPKKGSKFFLTIPHLKPEKSQDSGKKKESRKIYRWPGRKILIAEDQESNYLLLEAFFKNTGVKLLRAKDGVELLELFENESDVDMIFLDLKMPRMDGINAMKIIRESNKTIPVIAQTAYDRTYHREKCLELGCSEYFIKPLRKQELLETVLKYFGE